MNKLIKEQLRDTYNKYALYINKSIMEQWRIDLRQHISDVFMEYHVSTILDVGCGCGMDSKFFMDQGFIVKGIDLSDKLVDICKEKNIDVVKMDYYMIDKLSEKFDCIYAQNSLLHVPKKDFEDVLRKMSNQLKSNGILYIGMFGGIDRDGIYDNDFLNPPRFFNSYTDDGIIKEVSKFFEVIAFEKKYLKNNEFHYQSLFLQKRTNSRKDSYGTDRS